MWFSFLFSNFISFLQILRIWWISIHTIQNIWGESEFQIHLRYFKNLTTKTVELSQEFNGSKFNNISSIHCCTKYTLRKLQNPFFNATYFLMWFEVAAKLTSVEIFCIRYKSGMELNPGTSASTPNFGRLIGYDRLFWSATKSAGY